MISVRIPTPLRGLTAHKDGDRLAIVPAIAGG